MRIPVDIIFVAVAVCLVRVSTHAEPSGITTKLPCSLSADGSQVSTERQLRGQETIPDDEERVDPITGVNGLKSTFRDAHIEEWLTTNKSPADVVKLMAFDKAENALHGPKNFAVLGKFLRMFNVKNRKNRTSLIKVLITQYGEEGVFQIIEAAKQVHKTAKLAARLQEEQLQYWLGTKKDPKHVFAIMELDKAGNKLFENPLTITWVKYFDQFNKEYPDNPGPVSLLFLKEKYSEEDFVKMLIAAKEVPSTEKVAVRVQALVTTTWLKQQKPPEDIFLLLGLDNTDENVFRSPLFAAWIEYVDAYNLDPKDGQIADVLAILKEYYMTDYLDEMPIEMGRLALVLKRDLQERWFREDRTPETVGDYVKSLEPLEGSTLLRALDDYDTFFKRYQTSHKDYDRKANTLIEQFRDLEVVTEMILQALKNPKKRDTIWGMLEALSKHWLDQSVEPNTVRKWLRVEDTAADSNIKQLYSNYEMYNKIHDAPPTKRLKTTHSER